MDSPKLKDLSIVRLAKDEDVRSLKRANETEQEFLTQMIEGRWCIVDDFFEAHNQVPDFVELATELDLYAVIVNFANDVYEATPNYEHTVDRILSDYANEDHKYLELCAYERGTDTDFLMFHQWRA